MRKLTHKLKELGVRRIAFSLVVLVYLGFLGYISAMILLPGSGIATMGHFSFFSTGETHDLIHELVFAFIIGTAAVGLFSQLWRPKENFAGQLVTLFVWVAMFLTAVLTNNWVPQPLFIIFGGLTFLATILHPARATPEASARRAGRDLFNWFCVARINRVLFVLVIIVAVPLLVFAYTNFNLQIVGGGAGFSGLFSHQKPTYGDDSAINQELSPADAKALADRQDQMLNETEDMVTDDEADHDKKHVSLGHYRNLVAFSFIIIVVGLLASFKLKGCLFAEASAQAGRFSACVAGVLPVLLGLASLVLPDAESSLGVTWGLAAIIWGIVFIAVAEFIRRKELKEAQEL